MFTENDDKALLGLLKVTDDAFDDNGRLANGYCILGRDYMKVVLDHFLPYRPPWTDKGLSDPDFGPLPLRLSVDYEGKAIAAELDNAPVTLALVDEDGKVVEEGYTVYRDIGNDVIRGYTSSEYHRSAS